MGTAAAITSSAANAGFEYTLTVLRMITSLSACRGSPWILWCCPGRLQFTAEMPPWYACDDRRRSTSECIKWRGRGHHKAETL